MKKIFFVLALVALTIPNLSFGAGAATTESWGNNNDFVENYNPYDQASATTGNTVSSSDCKKPKDITTLFEYGICVLSGAVIPFLFGIALLIFLIGALNFVGAGDNEEKREGGRHMMIFGIICLFVMVSVWGFVKILTTSFGFEFELPSLPKKATGIYAK